MFNPKDIRVFFFDIDNTAFDHSIYAVRESTQEGLRKLKEKGYKCFICTSRSAEEMVHAPEALLRYMDGIVALAGAELVTENGRIYKTIDLEETKRCIEILDRNNCVYRYVVKGGKNYVNQYDDWTMEVWDRLYQMRPEIKPYEGEELSHLLFMHHPELDDEIRKAMPHAILHRLVRVGELTPEKTDKGYSIVETARALGYDQENTCAFGDGLNDVTMLKMAALGIAMGNAAPGCKEAADYVTDDISDEGLYNALVKFGFIE